MEPDALLVGARRYPILDGVVVLLEPDRCPASVRARLVGDAARAAEAPGDFAPDIQHTFGAEWQAYGEILPEHERELRQYFDLVDLESLRESRVADLGCGSGRWSSLLRHRVKEIVCVDFSEAIFVARRNLADAPNALFFLGDLKALPFADDCFDLAFCLGVLHHLPTPCLDEVRALRRLAPRLLVYLYYALDNRPAHFRLLLSGVTVVRERLARVRSPAARKAFSVAGTWLIYLPLVALGRMLRPFGLSSHVPLWDGYHDKGPRRIEQDVYDRFFTRIEQRVTREQIRGLTDTFSDVLVADGVPYWHFLCTR